LSAINHFTNSKIVSTKDKIKFYTESFGKYDNPAILLISGAMASARFWVDTFCQQLANAGYFVIRYDHRDMGLSSAIDYVKNPYTINDLARDAIAVLDAYNIKKTHVVGHSMGGAIAQLLTLDYPARISSITLVSSSVLANVKLTLQEKECLDKTWQEMMKNKPTKNYAKSVDGFLKSYAYLHGNITMDNNLALTYVKDMYERTKPEHLAWFEKFSAGIEPLHNHVKAQQNIVDRTKDLKKIQIPVLVIHGEKDSLALPRIIKQYCVSIIPQAKIFIIPGMGHMILNKDLFEKLENIILENTKS